MNEVVEVDFEVQPASNGVETTKYEGVLEQNETVDEWNEGAILHNETWRAHNEGRKGYNEHQLQGWGYHSW